MNTDTNLLKDLITLKYGADKFDTGCLLVTQWLNATTEKRISHERMKALCHGEVTPHFKRPHQEAIRKLFGKNYEP